MHGVPRKPPSTADETAAAAKAAKLRSLQAQFLHNHHNRIYSKEALEINAKLLEANPEFMTAWNYRRLAFEHNLNRQSDDQKADSDFIKSLLDEELLVVENALRKNFKSYGAWHHRKWVLNKGNSSTERELKLLNLFQKQDARNFHAWNYRRFVASLKNIPVKDELQYTKDMIDVNFSNYSAWHNRSVLLSHLMEEKVDGYHPKRSVLTEEYDFVRNAVFTDPDDQSGWFYHLWLLDQTVKLDTPMLLSSWPPHGSSLQVPINQKNFGLPLFTVSQDDTASFPLILYFSEAVKCVNSCTVTIQADYDIIKEIAWTPLSVNKFGCSTAWVTHLKIPHMLKPKVYPVKISIGQSLGITSLTGVPFSRASYFEFTVSVHTHDVLHSNGKIFGRILMRDENFFPARETLSGESSLLHSFYNSRTDEEGNTMASDWISETLANEIGHYRDLLSFVDCKIGKVTLTRLLMAYDAVLSNGNQNAPNIVHLNEVLQLYRDLMKLDPPHYRYYKDEHSIALLKQVTSSIDTLWSYCWQYRDPTFVNISNAVCLRLNSLSLSRIGSTGKLLWVQMLDLSKNELHSIEGLEAMQLLTCLNLGHNKLKSFSALDPLRMLKSLNVLDISYNEIGSHTVDTTHYLCSSPLSHTSDWNREETNIGDFKVAAYWEAFSIFRNMKLTQLDVIGNAAADERFKLFFRQVLPGLKWLDGEELH